MTLPNERTVRRHTFDEAAERYDRIRPGYPSGAFDEIERFAGLGPGSRVLEIGCGTGQATEELARRGYHVVAVELGPSLAVVARRNLGPYPDVEIVTADFERWHLPPDPFDAVVSATAFHWLDPEIRLIKSAEALRSGGALAVIDTDHIAGGSERFFAAVQDCYEQWDRATEPGLRLTPADEIDSNVDELESSGLFAAVEVHRFERDLEYSTSDYIDLLLTYSGHLALEAAARDGLLDCVRVLIDDDNGGRIAKRYLTTVRLARRPAEDREAS